jgi:hypothetical protein
MPAGGAICLCVCVKHDHAYVPLVVNPSRSFPHSWIITGFASRLTRQVSLVEKKLLTFLDLLSLPSVFSGVRVTRSLVLCVCFVDRRLSLCLSSFGHCVVCPSIYGFCLTPMVSSNSSYNYRPDHSLLNIYSNCWHVTPLVSSNLSDRLHFCYFVLKNCYFVFPTWLVGSLCFTGFVLFTFSWSFFLSRLWMYVPFLRQFTKYILLNK